MHRCNACSELAATWSNVWVRVWIEGVMLYWTLGVHVVRVRTWRCDGPLLGRELSVPGLCEHDMPLINDRAAMRLCGCGVRRAHPPISLMYLSCVSCSEIRVEGRCACVALADEGAAKITALIYAIVRSTLHTRLRFPGVISRASALRRSAPSLQTAPTSGLLCSLRRPAAVAGPSCALPRGCCAARA